MHSSKASVIDFESSAEMAVWSLIEPMDVIASRASLGRTTSSEQIGGAPAPGPAPTAPTASSAPGPESNERFDDLRFPAFTPAMARIWSSLDWSSLTCWPRSSAKSQSASIAPSRASLTSASVSSTFDAMSARSMWKSVSVLGATPSRLTSFNVLRQNLGFAVGALGGFDCAGVTTGDAVPRFSDVDASSASSAWLASPTAWEEAASS